MTTHPFTEKAVPRKRKNKKSTEEQIAEWMKLYDHQPELVLYSGDLIEGYK